VLAFDERGHAMHFRFVSGDLEKVDPPVATNMVTLLPRQRPDPDRGNAQFMLTWRSFRGGTCKAQPPGAAALRFFVGDHREASVNVHMQSLSDTSRASAPVAPCDGIVAVRVIEPASEPGLQ
jgi:hypothetical protein